MPPRQTVLDFAASAAARDAGINNADNGAAPDWKARATQQVLNVANTKTTFTTDDVWATGLEKPHEPRALGAVMMHMSKLGLIETTGEYVKTAQVSRHKAPIAVWRKRA